MLNMETIWRRLSDRVPFFSRRDSLIDLFKNDSMRVNRYCAEAAGWRLDYAKNLIDSPVLSDLFELAGLTGLKQKIEQLFSASPVNFTEKKPAGHVRLRCPLEYADSDVVEARKILYQLVETIHNCQVTGIEGKAITDVVNIGIGGSDLGPKLVCQALQDNTKSKLKTHFISNVDYAPLIRLLNQLNPKSTLFIVVSKSFTTAETNQNFSTIKQWLAGQTGDNNAWKSLSIAVTANFEQALEAGFDSQKILTFDQTIGGRYSLWSAAGLSIILQFGPEVFERLLAGAYQMDQHFSSAPWRENLPILLALLEIWYVDFWRAQTLAIIPYTDNLKLFPAYLQQLEMESNGKAVNQENQFLDYPTAPIIWGEPGTNCQHSFMQLLHQAHRLIPVDFIAFLTQPGEKVHHCSLFANCLSQAHVLMTGKSLLKIEKELIEEGILPEQARQLAKHKVLPGGKPSNLLVAEQLTPETLGALLALYEHKVFTAASIWGINPFDQWGVETGKVVAQQTLEALQDTNNKIDLDPSTNALIQLYREKNYA